MRGSMAGLMAGAALLLAAWIGHAAAATDEPQWWVEPEMGTAFDYQGAEFRAAGPTETGSMRPGGETTIWVEEGIGTSYDYVPGQGG